VRLLTDAVTADRKGVLRRLLRPWIDELFPAHNSTTLVSNIPKIDSTNAVSRNDACQTMRFPAMYYCCSQQWSLAFIAVARF
jgi:hypothetical protein